MTLAAISRQEGVLPEIGQHGKPFPLVIEAGKVREFALAIGADPIAGVPPTFLEVSRHWRRPESLAWAPEGELRTRTLNASQEYEFPAGPLSVGMRLTGRMCVVGLERREGRRAGELTFVRLETRYQDEGGRTVAISTQTTVTMARRPQPGGTPSATPTPRAPSAWEATAAPLTITDSVRYQGACGEMSPVHHDGDLAREMGYEGPFTIGGLPAGKLVAEVSAWLGGAPPRRFRVAFRAQAWPGQALTYRADPVAVRTDKSGGRIVEVAMSASGPGGSPCIEGEGSWPVLPSVPQAILAISS